MWGAWSVRHQGECLFIDLMIVIRRNNPYDFPSYRSTPKLYCNSAVLISLRALIVYIYRLTFGCCLARESCIGKLFMPHHYSMLWQGGHWSKRRFQEHDRFRATMCSMVYTLLTPFCLKSTKCMNQSATRHVRRHSLDKIRSSIVNLLSGCWSACQKP